LSANARLSLFPSRPSLRSLSVRILSLTRFAPCGCLPPISAYGIMPLPGDRAWRTCLNTSVLCTFISGRIGEIRSRFTSNAPTQEAARSAQKSILGTTSWEWVIRRTRRRRILRKNGRPRVSQPTCIQARHGKAALNLKNRLLPSRQRHQNQLLKPTRLLLRSPPVHLRLRLLPRSHRRLPVRRLTNQARRSGPPCRSTWLTAFLRMCHVVPVTMESSAVTPFPTIGYA
jgi:hypothetical protein